VNRYWLTLGVAFSCLCDLAAQNTSTVGEVKQAYTRVKNNLVKAAENMPEDNYGFQPVPEIRTFGKLVAHIADSQAGNCSSVNGQRKSVDAGSKTSKADIVAALKESVAICDAAYDSLTDANSAEMVTTQRGSRPKLGILIGNLAHDNEEYGYLAVYLRLKGVVPPSSEGR